MVYQTRTNYIFVHSKRKVLFTFGALIIRDEVVNETDTASFVGVIFGQTLIMERPYRICRELCS